MAKTLFPPNLRAFHLRTQSCSHGQKIWISAKLIIGLSLCTLWSTLCCVRSIMCIASLITCIALSKKGGKNSTWELQRR
ncbi:hypothetical protein LINGRAHAP2_LOCUS20404 [Linum grandiflorum]